MFSAGVDVEGFVRDERIVGCGCGWERERDRRYLSDTLIKNIDFRLKEAWFGDEGIHRYSFNALK